MMRRRDVPPPRPRTPPKLPDPHAALSAALERRAALLSEVVNAVRLFHDAADGIPGLVIERFGPVLISQLHEGRLALDEAAVHALCAAAMRHAGATAVYRKFFPRDRSTALARLEAQHSSAQPWIGAPAPPEVAVRENGLQFLVRPYDGYATGLFLEHRDNRERIRELARARRVLNLFAYTCAFSIAAGAGGAATTTSVDVSKKSLEWGKRNFAANHLALDTHTFIASDVFDYFDRANRQGRRFDLIILDPPTFGRAKGAPRAFELKRDLPQLLDRALTLLDPDGYVLAATNHRQTPAAELERLIREAAAPRRIVSLEHLPLPPDFAGDPGFAKSVLARVA